MKEKEKKKERKKKGCLLGGEISFFLSHLKDLERRRRRTFFHSRGVRHYLLLLLVPPEEYLTIYYLPSIPSASLQPAGTYLVHMESTFPAIT